VINLKSNPPRLDAMLHDGLNNNKITEVTGLSGSGKTRFCFKLMLSILASTSEKLIYLDSGSSFSFERLEYYCNVILSVEFFSIKYLKENIFIKFF